MDPQFQGDRRFTLCAYLEAQPGFMKNFKSKRRVCVTFDNDRNAVFVHSEFQGGKYYYVIPFCAIEKVSCDISQRDRDRWYTTIFSRRVFTFMFKNHHDWFKFTEVFRHVRREGAKASLFPGNESYLEFELNYVNSPERRRYNELKRREEHIKEAEVESDEEHHHRIHIGNNPLPRQEDQDIRKDYTEKVTFQGLSQKPYQESEPKQQSFNPFVPRVEGQVFENKVEDIQKQDYLPLQGTELVGQFSQVLIQQPIQGVQNISEPRAFEEPKQEKIGEKDAGKEDREHKHKFHISNPFQHKEEDTNKVENQEDKHKFHIPNPFHHKEDHSNKEEHSNKVGNQEDKEKFQIPNQSHQKEQDQENKHKFHIPNPFHHKEEHSNKVGNQEDKDQFHIPNQPHHKEQDTNKPENREEKHKFHVPNPFHHKEDDSKKAEKLEDKQNAPESKPENKKSQTFHLLKSFHKGAKEENAVKDVLEHQPHHFTQKQAFEIAEHVKQGVDPEELVARH